MTEQGPDNSACRCGSGLSRLRCCDLDPAALPGEPALALLEPQGLEATRLFNDKKYEAAEALALKTLDLAPNQRLALRVLFEIRKAQNRLRAAEALGRRLAGLPGPALVRAAANILIAQFYVGLGRHQAAREPAAAAVKATPRDATAQHVLGVVLTETGALAEGETHYRRAVALLGREDGLVLANLAWNLKLQGRLGEAARLYGQALALRPDNRRGLGGQAQVELGRGNPARAAALIDQGLAQWPQERTLRLLRAITDLALAAPQEVLTRLPGPPEQLLAPELAVRGQALDRLGKPAEAVLCFATAKKLLRERAGQVFDPAPFLKLAADQKRFFTAERMQPLPRAALRAPWQPVFLLGFARSGTALLEQLLAQLPGFSPGDEMAPIAELAALVPRLLGTGLAYPEALDETLVGQGVELAGLLRARYAAARLRLGLITKSTRFVTDRNASNLWHLGLIKLMFPDAPIIHLLRHPYDIMLSVLSQDKKFEANCGVSMPAAAQHYALGMDMLEHFRGQLTLRYLPVRYEDLVARPAATLRNVLEFVGADFSLLPPEETLIANAAPVCDPVPAHYATREKLHRRGLARHARTRAVLPNLFAEVQDILAPHIERLGYGAAP